MVSKDSLSTLLGKPISLEKHDEKKYIKNDQSKISENRYNYTFFLTLVLDLHIIIVIYLYHFTGWYRQSIQFTFKGIKESLNTQ